MNELRAVCVKCGRKRVKRYLHQPFYYYKCTIYKSNWFVYPHVNSWKCIDECLAYHGSSGEVQLTSVKK